MAGAYTAVAEGIDGATVNAASPAVREPYSYDWLDYDIDLDFSLPGAYGGTDFDNHGPPQGTNGALLQSTTNGFYYLHAGAELQLGELGFSATAELFQYTINPPSGSTTQGLTLVYGRYHALAAYGLADNQIVVGGGVRIITLGVKTATKNFNGGHNVVTLNGVGPEAGIVIKPNGFPFRVGSTIRSAVGATQTGVVGQVGGIFGGSGSSSEPASDSGFRLPDQAHVPWELETGFAFQLGPRPLNPAWPEPHDMESIVRRRIDNARAVRKAEQERELAATPAAEKEARKRQQAATEQGLREIEDQELDAESTRLRAIRVARNQNWPRERITIYGSLLITGISHGAVSLEGFAQQLAEPVGRSVTLTPRLGVESEPVRDLIDARFGSYLEPSRFEQGSARQHFTFGGDIRLIHFSPWGIFGDQIWRLTVAADLAPRYQNFGIGIGAWH